MLSCPDCGGNLKFDIPSQQMKCEFCNSTFDPYQFDSKDKDAQEAQDFEVTIFTCPQCGGEILSTDNAAAGFCSFCGASTILHSRIANEKRPGYIIPFQKTKEECKQSYADLMKKAIFAPRDLKDPAKIDSFRGIYMPYWTYYITQKGALNLQGSTRHRSGDYIIEDHYQLNGTLDAYYKGLSYDASSSYDDTISQAVGPYNVKGMKAFTPAYLSGFYADIADVEPSVYAKDALDVATRSTRDSIEKNETFGVYSMDTTITPELLNSEIEETDRTMFPVWFMSYRNGDRVAYATVNGQSGKVVANLPVDKKKYYLGSLLLAVPIFVLLSLFFTIVPRTLLVLSGILSIVAAISYFSQSSMISQQEREFPTGKKRLLGLICTIVSLIAGVGIFFLKPVSDLWYYGCVIVMLISVFILFTDTISYYNILSTRELPQFEKKGGDDRA